MTCINRRGVGGQAPFLIAQSGQTAARTCFRAANVVVAAVCWFSWAQGVCDEGGARLRLTFTFFASFASHYGPSGNMEEPRPRER